jgi:hypothetical protein
LRLGIVLLRDDVPHFGACSVILWARHLPVAQKCGDFAGLPVSEGQKIALGETAFNRPCACHVADT